MTDSLASDIAAVVLAAGAGSRLRPLTRLRPKALCPVGNVALVDHALMRTRAVTDTVAVNVHHGRSAMEAHLAARSDVFVSVEEPVALGTAGAIAQLRGWLDGRHVLVINADAWGTADLVDCAAGWDRTRVRVVVGADGVFGPTSKVHATFLPSEVVAGLDARPSGLYETVWAAASAQGRLDVVGSDALLIDCGTPARYLAANLASASSAPDGSIVADDACGAGGVQTSVIGSASQIDGSVVDTVVWAGAAVSSGEHLMRAVRTDRGVTVFVR